MARYVVQIEDQASKPADAAASSVSRLGATLGGLKGLLGSIGGPIASVSASVQGLGSRSAEAVQSMASFGASAGPVGLAVAAIVAVAALGAIAVAGLAAACWELAGAALAVAQRRAALLATFNAFTDGAGKQALGALSALAERLPFSTGQVSQWGKALAQAGIADAGALQKGAYAVASAAATLSDHAEEAAAATVSLIGRLTGLAQVGATVKLDNKMLRSIRDVGLEAQDLAVQLGTTPEKLRSIGVAADKMSTAVQDALIRKGKGPLEQMGLTLGAIKQKVSEGIGVDALVKDLAPAIEPFMKELRSFAEEFFKGSIAADVAKGAVTGVMTSLFQLATSALTEVHVGFLQLENYALRAAIAVAPTVLWLRRMWAEHDGSGKLLAVLKYLAIGLGVIGAAIALPLAAMVLLGVVGAIAFGGLVAGIVWLVAKIVDAASAFGSWASSAYGIASDFVSGLIDGIKAGVAKVGDAAGDLANSAIAAVKGVLDSHSPSRVMMGVGVDTALGMAQGIDAAAPDVAEASRGLGAAAAGGAAGPRGRRSGRGGDLKIPIVINIAGNVDRDVFAMLEEGLAEVVERVVGRSGLLEPEPEPA